MAGTSRFLELYDELSDASARHAAILEQARVLRLELRAAESQEDKARLAGQLKTLAAKLEPWSQRCSELLAALGASPSEQCTSQCSVSSCTAAWGLRPLRIRACPVGDGLVAAAQVDRAKAQAGKWETSCSAAESQNSTRSEAV